MQANTFVVSGKISRDNAFQGRPQDLGGGDQEFFFSDLGICMSRSDMLALRIARGVRGHAPQEKNFKTMQFGEF